MAKPNRGGQRAAQSSNNSNNANTNTNSGGGGGGGGSFNWMTDQQAQQLRDDMDGNYEPDVVNAIKMYISSADVNGDGFSYSQNLNYKLDNGIKLDVNEQYIDNFMQQGMHDIGNNTSLFRACHDDILKACGIANYSRMSEAQLQKALVGTTFKTTAYMSTSYDKAKSPFYHGNSSSGVGGGREVYMNIKAKGSTKVVFGAKSQAEMIINKGTDFKITGIHYDGTTATPRGRGSMPRVVIDIETI